MLRFTLFGFPVLIHGMFWLNTALMGGALYATTPAQFSALLAWMVAVLLSILIHELGHALVMRNFGDRRVVIQLIAFGGIAQGSQWRTRREDFIVSAAGPVLQILAGLAAGWTITLWQPPYLWLHRMLDGFTIVSIFWALLNLLPILPLDGGHLCRAYAGAGKQRQVLVISLVCAAVLALLSFQNAFWLGLQDRVLALLDIHARTRVGGGLLPLIIFGMLAWNNWKQLRNEPQIPWMNAR
jgi:stage IV sporulation protein FB